MIPIFFQERIGAAVSRDASVQHQRAVQRVRQVLLRPETSCRGQRAHLSFRAALQGARSQAGSHGSELRRQIDSGHC